MTLATLGIAAEFADQGIAANCLWPRTTIATDGVGNVLGGPTALARRRRPEITAEAAHLVLTTPSRERSGSTLVDEDVLAESGVTDFSAYATTQGATDLETDFLL
jgi:citronellol/citronellal dehydrogenase